MDARPLPSRNSDEGGPYDSRDYIRLPLESELCAILFTARYQVFEFHEVHTECYGVDYFHCAEEDCVLCQMNRPLETFWLLPVVDIFGQTIASFPIRPSTNPKSLHAVILREVQLLEDRFPYRFIKLKQLQDDEFEAKSLPLFQNDWRFSNSIARSIQAFEAGKIDLSRDFIPGDSFWLEQIPEFEKEMRSLGIIC